MGTGGDAGADSKGGSGVNGRPLADLLDNLGQSPSLVPHEAARRTLTDAAEVIRRGLAPTVYQPINVLLLSGLGTDPVMIEVERMAAALQGMGDEIAAFDDCLDEVRRLLRKPARVLP